MKVFYCLSIKMVDKVPMLELHRKRAADWLKTWTPKNNFKAILAENSSGVIETFRKEVARTVERVGYPPGNFEFNVYSTATESIDGVLRLDWNAEAAARCVTSDVNAGGLE